MTNEDEPINKPSRSVRSHSAVQREALHAAIDQLPDHSLEEALNLLHALHVLRLERPITDGTKLAAEVRPHLRVVK